LVKIMTVPSAVPTAMSQNPIQPRRLAVSVSAPPMFLAMPEYRNPMIKNVVKISAISTPCAVSS